MSQIGFHPVATAATSEEARQGRSEMDLAIVADPAAARNGIAGLFEGPPTPEVLQGMGTATVNAFAAFARSDWEINTLAMHSTRFTFESGDGQSKVMIDLPRRLDGVGEYISGMRDFLSVWTPYEFVTERIAFARGPRLLQMGRSVGSGARSGVTVDTPVSFLYEWEGPWIVSQRYWWDEDLAMEEAEVDPAAVLALPPR